MEHVLPECPLLQQLKIKLHDRIGDRLTRTSSMLGGKPKPQPQPMPSLPGRHSNTRGAHNTGDKTRTDTNVKEQWEITSTELNAVVDFAEDSRRFLRKEDAKNRGIICLVHEERKANTYL